VSDEASFSTPVGGGLSPLTPSAEELYLQAIERGGIAETGPEHSADLQHLLALGLLRRGVDSPGYIPVDPQSAAEQQQRNAAQQLAQATALREGWASLTTAYRAAQGWHDPSALARYVEGKEAITQQLALVYSGPLKLVRTVQPGGPRPADVLESSLAEDLGLLGRQVHRQILYQTPARHHAPTRQYVRAVTAAGAEVRTLDYLPDRLFLLDEVAVYPLNGDNSIAVFNREPSAVSFMHRLFQQHWERAAPYESAAVVQERDQRLTRDQRRSVRLACEQGLTAEAIADRTGWSKRTVDRHLAIAREVYDDANSLAALAWRLREEHPKGLPADW
jgi:DNA-directed RNA polymerase specialized sigma24 family protein